MKRFWLVLLSLGLIVAFSTQAMAVDLKITGEYYAAGMYLDKTTLHKNPSTIPWTLSSRMSPTDVPSSYPENPGPSTAFYFQRLRLNAELTMAPGFTFVTRADVMERAWGAARSTPAGGLNAVAAPSNTNVDSAGTRAENENIAFDLAYVSYISPIGMFNVGYQIDKKWGTVFGDNSVPNGQILYGIRLGGWTGAFIMGKESQLQALLGAAGEQSNPRGQYMGKAITVGGNPVNIDLADLNNNADADTNYYNLVNYYNWKNGEAGLLLRYQRVAAPREINLSMNTPAGMGLDDLLQMVGYSVPNIYEPKIDLYIMAPYFKQKIGNVSLEGEIHYVFGKWAMESQPSPSAKLVQPNLGDDIRVDVLNVYLNADADLGKFYVGGSLAYLSGDDPNDNVDRTIGLDGGAEWNPCLIMWNRDRTQWAGSLNGYTVDKDVLSNTTASLDGPMYNAWFFQVRGGVRPVEKLDIGMSISYANAVVKPTNAWLYNDYGWEVDLTGTYKITNNLTYMLGGAYLFTGKFFKANNDANEIQDDYMLLNKLTLTF